MFASTPYIHSHSVGSLPILNANNNNPYHNHHNSNNNNSIPISIGSAVISAVNSPGTSIRVITRTKNKSTSKRASTAAVNQLRNNKSPIANKSNYLLPVIQQQQQQQQQQQNEPSIIPQYSILNNNNSLSQSHSQSQLSIINAAGASLSRSKSAADINQNNTNNNGLYQRSRPLQTVAGLDLFRPAETQIVNNNPIQSIKPTANPNTAVSAVTTAEAIAATTVPINNTTTLSSANELKSPPPIISPVNPNQPARGSLVRSQFRAPAALTIGLRSISIGRDSVTSPWTGTGTGSGSAVSIMSPVPSSPAVILPSPRTIADAAVANYPANSPFTAVQHQRAYRAALVDQARQRALLANQPSALSADRRNSLGLLIQRRPSQAQLAKTNILRSPTELLSPNSKIQLDLLLSRRPSASDLHKRNILLYETATDRANKLKLLLSKRPEPLQLAKKNILLQSSESNHHHHQNQHSRSLSQSSDSSSISINEYQPLQSPTPDVKQLMLGRRASELSQLLQHRPHFEHLMKKHILYHQPNEIQQSNDNNSYIEPESPFSPSGRKRSFTSAQQSISTFLSARSTLSDLKLMTQNMLQSTVNRAGEAITINQQQQQDQQQQQSSQINNNTDSNNNNNQFDSAISLSAVNSAMVQVNKILSDNRAQQRHELVKHMVQLLGGLYMMGDIPSQLGLGSTGKLQSQSQSQSLQQSIVNNHGIVIHPQLISALTREIIVQVSCGSGHTLIRTNDGKLYGFGLNTSGQLGLGDTVDRSEAFMCSYRDSPLYKKSINYITTGYDSSAVITDQNELYVFGSNKNSVLGLGNPTIGNIANNNTTNTATASQSIPLIVTKPLLQPDLSNSQIHRISIGLNHSSAITITGGMYNWGIGSSGQLGIGDSCNYYRPKLLIQYDEFWHEVNCGNNYTVAIAFDGNVYSFGSNLTGALGYYPLNNQLTPKIIMSLWRKGVNKVLTSNNQTLALTEDGELMATTVIDQLGSDSIDHIREQCKFHRLHPKLNFIDAAINQQGIIRAITGNNQHNHHQHHDKQHQQNQQHQQHHSHSTSVSHLYEWHLNHRHGELIEFTSINTPIAGMNLSAINCSSGTGSQWALIAGLPNNARD